MCGGFCRRTSSIHLTVLLFMDEYDDLNVYNGEAEHDMWVDFDHYENTGIPMFSTKTTSKIMSLLSMTGTNLKNYIT